MLEIFHNSSEKKKKAGVGRQEATGCVITIWKDRRSRKSKCAVQQAEQPPGQLRAWRPRHARGRTGRLWERPRVNVLSGQLSSPPLHRKVRGSPAPSPLEKWKCRSLASAEGNSDMGHVDHTALPCVRILAARLPYTRGRRWENRSRAKAATHRHVGVTNRTAASCVSP